MPEEKDEKRPTAHETAIVLLSEDPQGNLVVIARLYNEGAIVPLKEIPALINAIKRAKATVEVLIDHTVERLEEQLQEAENKEEEGKKEED